MAKVQPIPPGCDRVIPHLVIKGCAEAIPFYAKAFGAEEVMRMPGPDGKSVMHAEIRIGNSLIFLADEWPGYPSAATLKGSPVSLTLYVEDADKAYNRAVAAGAKATMPLMNAFWGDRYGKLEDPFGHHWAIVSHIEDVPPEEMGKRAAEAMKNMKC
ncbi:MAG: VOC family protein [Gemmataceae bacterium]|nr:VOC family protein [Gemmataceae bacterium]